MSILNTAFTLLGSNVTWLETIAFVFTIGNLICNVFEIHWAWPLTIFCSLLYIRLFYENKLYGEAGVNLFFAVAALWGWWQWLHGHHANSKDPLQIAKLQLRGWLLTISGWLTSWFLCTILLERVTNSDVPWLDGFVTAGSIVGTYLIGRKFIENWLIWMLVNAVSVVLFWHKNMYLMAILYSIFFFIAIWGWFGWRLRIPDRA